MKKLVRVKDVAELLNVSAQRVYEMVRLSLLPAIRLGRTIRFDMDKIEDWIESGGQALEGGWRRGG